MIAVRARGPPSTSVGAVSFLVCRILEAPTDQYWAFFRKNLYATIARIPLYAALMRRYAE